MTIRTTGLGGANFNYNETPLASADLNDTFNELAARSVYSPGVITRTAENSDYNDANDTMIMLSSTRYLAFDDSAKVILLTTDSGANWTAVQSAIATTLTKFYVNPNDPNYITFYDATYNGSTYYSTDAGATWSTITAPANATQDYVSYSITDTGRIYCLSNPSTARIDYSNDGGTNWVAVTGFFAYDNNSTSALATPKNDIICYVYHVNHVSYDEACGYTLDGGSNWVENQYDGGSVAHLSTCLYIDSDNYLIDAQVYTNDGIHIVKWNGTVISSSASDPWRYNDTNVNCLIRFDAEHFIYQKNIYNDTSYDSVIYSYDASGKLSIINSFGILAGSDYFLFHGISTDADEDRLFNTTIQGDINTCTEEHEIWSDFYYLRNR